jgi:hypothetical protein
MTSTSEISPEKPPFAALPNRATLTNGVRSCVHVWTSALMEVLVRSCELGARRCSVSSDNVWAADLDRGLDLAISANSGARKSRGTTAQFAARSRTRAASSQDHWQFLRLNVMT